MIVYAIIRTKTNHVIASQCAHWRGNPPIDLKQEKKPRHPEGR